MSPEPIKPLPCPFCGQPAREPKRYIPGDYWYTGCYDESHGTIEVQRPTKDEAVAAWNARRPLPADGLDWKLELASIVDALNTELREKVGGAFQATLEWHTIKAAILMLGDAANTHWTRGYKAGQALPPSAQMNEAKADTERLDFLLEKVRAFGWSREQIDAALRQGEKPCACHSGSVCGPACKAGKHHDGCQPRQEKAAQARRDESIDIAMLPCGCADHENGGPADYSARCRR